MRRLSEPPLARFLGACFALSLAVRLAALWVWESRGLDAVVGYDPYPMYAQVLLGWLPPAPVVAYPPVYPFWTALVFAVMRSPSFLAVKAMNVVLGAASVALFGLWADRRLPRAGARLAALWLAFDPLLVYFSVQLQSEPLFVALLGALFLALDASGNPPSPSGAFVTGLLGGVAMLTRSVVAPYPAFLIPACLWARRSLGGAAVWLLLCAGWALPPALWGLRNLRVHGQFIPIAANGGISLWEGFTVDRDEVRRRPYDMREETARLGLPDDRDLFAVSRHYTQKTLAFIRARPGAAARIVAGKALLYWRPWVYDPYPVPVRWAAGLYFSALFFLAAAGAWGLRGDAGWAPVWALILCLSALHAVLFTSVRYRTPLEPLLVCLAAEGLRRLSARAGPSPG